MPTYPPLYAFSAGGAMSSGLCVPAGRGANGTMPPAFKEVKIESLLLCCTLLASASLKIELEYKNLLSNDPYKKSDLSQPVSLHPEADRHFIWRTR
ncbi:hypothetical protein BJX68DRAFT_226065 [Aspergillus pseudodeflectus]|uniref:Uncharacterized protein n=1 Tax=Aspergillus pseudodeflectus TaxID=176178 RepID=A0ABR4L529_9EURO